MNFYRGSDNPGCAISKMHLCLLTTLFAMRSLSANGSLKMHAGFLKWNGTMRLTAKLAKKSREGATRVSYTGLCGNC